VGVDEFLPNLILKKKQNWKGKRKKKKKKKTNIK